MDDVTITIDDLVLDRADLSDRSGAAVVAALPLAAAGLDPAVGPAIGAAVVAALAPAAGPATPGS
jgi:hypothetical protein